MKVFYLPYVLFLWICVVISHITCFSQKSYSEQQIDDIVQTTHTLITQYFQDNHAAPTVPNLFLNFGQDAYVEVLGEDQITRYHLQEFLSNSYVSEQPLPKLYGVDIMFLHDIHAENEGNASRYEAKADYYIYWVKADNLKPQLRNIDVTLTPDYYDHLVQQGFDKGYVVRLNNIRFYGYGEDWDLSQLGDMTLCTRPQALSEYHIPVFEYPFPSYSNVYPMEKASYFPNCFTWGNVEEKIRYALNACQYRKIKYYLLSKDGENLNGFVLLTELEKIDASGNSTEKCKTDTQPESYLSLENLKNLIRQLFSIEPGYYRMLAFAVTDLPIISDASNPSKEEIMRIQKGGASTFSNRLANTPLADSYQITAVVYEFRISKADGTVSVTDARLAGKTHLDKAGVLPNWLK